MKLIKLLRGKKTYIVSALIVTYAVAGYLLGYITAEEAGKLLLEASGFAALRNGIK